MSNPVFFDVLERQEEVIKSLDLHGFGDHPGVQTDYIEIRDAPINEYERDREEFRDEHFPSVLITPGDVRKPKNEGTNVKDDTYYRVLTQILDRNDARFSRDMLKSHLSWIQKIQRAIHGNPWDNDEDFGDAKVNIAWSESVKVIDSTLFWQHKYFVRGIVTEYIAREPRDSA